jgi:uncharacterized membrane protein
MHDTNNLFRINEKVNQHKKTNFHSIHNTMKMTKPLDETTDPTTDDIMNFNSLHKQSHDTIIQKKNPTNQSLTTNNNTLKSSSSLSSLKILTTKIQEFILTHHAAFLAISIIILSVLFNPLPAFSVQSGGRIGGSFGPSSSSSRSSSSSSYSRGTTSGSYSRGFNRGYTSGYFSRPSVIVNPLPTTPFYNPYVVGPTYYTRPGGVVVSTGFSPFAGLFSFGVIFFLLSIFSSGLNSSLRSRNIGFDSDSTTTTSTISALGKGYSVAQISLAMEVPDRDSPNSILNILNQLSNTARSDSRVGIQNLTSQVALELLRKKSLIVAGVTKSVNCNDFRGAEREFNRWAINERGKFESETVSKFKGVDYSQGKSTTTPTLLSSSFSTKSTLAVITIILSIEGDTTKLPRITSESDVVTALSRIAADAKVDDCLQGVEILWTPEERSETLTKRDVIADYSDLRFI